jgi:hypothetical protein
VAPGVGEPAHLCSAVPTGVMAPGAGDPIILEFAVVFHSSPGFGAKLSSVVRYTRRGRRHDGGSQARLLGAGCAAARDGQDRGGLVSSAPTAPPLARLRSQRNSRAGGDSHFSISPPLADPLTPDFPDPSDHTARVRSRATSTRRTSSCPK